MVMEKAIKAQKSVGRQLEMVYKKEETLLE